ncbi:cell division protein ZapE [Jiangella aurantiaca]|uniref:Cell division protein ZapE n=1 Tax=Jiangella aurantiaca TaxID=2530373 RepID=A0A4R5AJ33_9ACTN|nr:cell division protein ZapE [Jiangella aurantiaca]TDD71530.1 cell division protein ZapE [Jiangella aurantiaca]
MPDRIADRRPDVPASRLVTDMVPPPRFRDVSFDSYRADPAVPSQAAAVAAARAFAAAVGDGVSGRRRGWFRSRGAGAAADIAGPGIYLDGGFGVGKTHLLASLWHAAPVPVERKLFCTFVELTNLAGALGFAATVEALSAHRLVCVDEFELDDPGDTVLVSTLLSRLSEHGVRLAATSNTLPDQLGEGRFAAADFLREIQRLAARFTVVRVDGEDYRHRGLPSSPPPVSDDVVAASAEGDGVTLDDFDALVAHLATVHPSRYGPLLDGVSRVHLRGVRTVDDQSTALRLVVLADRLYDRDLPVVAGGVPLDRLFTPELLAGGYRKKYFRAVSRLTALSRDGAAALGSR